MSNVVLSHHRSLLGPELNNYMNITISIEGEKEKVHAPRNVLEKRCGSLLVPGPLIKKQKEKKGDSGIMTIEYRSSAFSLTVLHQILEYCYTGGIPFDNMELPDVMVLLKSALNLDCPRLVYLCEHYIREKLTVDSVFLVLKKCKELELEDLKTLATSFAHQNWPQFCAHKAGMEIIGIELFQELTIAMQFFKEETKLDASPGALKVVPNTIVSDWKALLEEARFADADFLFPNPDIAENIKFHRCVVAAHSKPLLQLISTSKSKQYVIEGISYTATKDLLEYIYFGNTQLNPVGACKLIEHVINQYALPHILDHCITSISNGISDPSSLDILRVTYLPNFQTPTMQELRKKVLLHICENFTNIAIPTVRDVKPHEIAYEMLADILDTIHSNFGNLASSNGGAKLRKTKSKKKNKTPRTHSTSSTKEKKKPRT